MPAPRRAVVPRPVGPRRRCRRARRVQALSVAPPVGQATRRPAAGGRHRRAPLKTFTVGIPLLRPGTITADQTSLAMLWPNANVYERLFEMDEQFQLKPMLAERYEFREPGTWRFHLRGA